MADPRIQNANQATGQHLFTCETCRSGAAGACLELRGLAEAAIDMEALVLAENLGAAALARPELSISHDGCLTLTANAAGLAALYQAARAMLVDPECLSSGRWRDGAPWLRIERLDEKNDAA